MKQVDKTGNIGIEFMQGLVRRVDVETEWNLKSLLTNHDIYSKYVDVETEWNLKNSIVTSLELSWIVDVETEWNLKENFDVVDVNGEIR